MNEKVSIAKIKSQFSEFISKVAFSHKCIIITKRNKPIAALIDLNVLSKVESVEEREGLASIIGKWENFNEISESIEEVYKSRNKDKLRNVSI